MHRPLPLLPLFLLALLTMHIPATHAQRPAPSKPAQGARGLARGLIYDRAGRLIASVAQEGLMREVSR